MAGAFTYGSSVVCDGDNLPALLVMWGSNMNQTTGGSSEGKPESMSRPAASGAVDPPEDRCRPARRPVDPAQAGWRRRLAGMLKVIIEEKLYDQDIVDHGPSVSKLRQHFTTFSWTRSKGWTCSRAQVESSRKNLRRTKPAAMQTGMPLDQLVNSFQTTRAIAIMRAICGSVNVPARCDPAPPAI
jgi:hypothetical protein